MTLLRIAITCLLVGSASRLVAAPADPVAQSNWTAVAVDEQGAIEVMDQNVRFDGLWVEGWIRRRPLAAAATGDIVPPNSILEYWVVDCAASTYGVSARVVRKDSPQFDWVAVARPQLRYVPLGDSPGRIGAARLLCQAAGASSAKRSTSGRSDTQTGAARPSFVASTRLVVPMNSAAKREAGFR